MEEKEVLRKLGLENERELSELDQLNKYSLDYDEKNDLFRLSDKDELVVNNSLSHLSSTQLIQPILFYRDYAKIIITGWRALLYVAPASDEDSENHEPSWIKKKIENGKGTSVDKVMVGESELIGKETKITKSDLNIQAGHLLGKFSGILQNIEKYLGTDQNIDNIMTYPQFKRANESSKEYSGQSKVESNIWNNRDTCFYYEAEAIFANINDNIPIGTRLRVIPVRKNEKDNRQYVIDSDADEEIAVHVFIPNCDYAEEDSKSVLKRENTVDDYRTFFKGGNLNSLKWK